MYTHLLLISTVQIPRAYCSFFYYNIFIVSEQVFLRFFMNLSRYARMCNSSHHLQDATEKLFFHTIYSVSKLIDVLYFVLIYTQKGLFQWPSYRGEGILATVVKLLFFTLIWISTTTKKGHFPKISLRKMSLRYIYKAQFISTTT